MSNQTIQNIADELGMKAHQVRYVVATRKIEPAGWIGHTRVFDAQAVARIAAELRNIRSR